MDQENLSIIEMLLTNPYVRMGLAVVMTSLGLSILNFFPIIKNSEKWYLSDNFLLLEMAVLFTVLTTAFELESFSDLQTILMKIIFTVMVSFLVAKTKGQEIADKVVNKVAKVIGDKTDSVEPK